MIKTTYEKISKTYFSCPSFGNRLQNFEMQAGNRGCKIGNLGCADVYKYPQTVIMTSSKFKSLQLRKTRLVEGEQEHEVPSLNGTAQYVKFLALTQPNFG